MLLANMQLMGKVKENIKLALFDKFRVDGLFSILIQISNQLRDLGAEDIKISSKYIDYMNNYANSLTKLYLFLYIPRHVDLDQFFQAIKEFLDDFNLEKSQENPNEISMKDINLEYKEKTDDIPIQTILVILELVLQKVNNPQWIEYFDNKKTELNEMVIYIYIYIDVGCIIQIQRAN